MARPRHVSAGSPRSERSPLWQPQAVHAAAFIVSLPVLTAGFAAQDKLVQGLFLGSVK